MRVICCQGRKPGSVTAVVCALASLCLPSIAQALTLSPLNGTPDASPTTQISFLGAPAASISKVSVRGSRSGVHGGRLRPYASATGASFLPARPFAPGEQVMVSALVKGAHVSSKFEVARQLPNPTAFAAGPVARASSAGVQSFPSEPELRPPTVAVTARSDELAPGLIFLTPTRGYGQPGTMIIDDWGRLVWFKRTPPGMVATNLQVQQYQSRPVLVWWQGHISDGVGFGTDQIYGSDYRPVKTLRAGNGYEADLHAVRLTAQGAAYITAYSLIRADLSSVGGARNAILQDSIVQEVDVATGLVMFEWHAFGHVALSDSYYRPGPTDRPWDYFHVNSISPDPWPDGDFIISARNTWAGYEIDHHSGAIRWRIGGKHSSFHMGPGTGTAWQHDVRWQPDHTLTFFDNGAVPKRHAQSRVIHERVDWAHRTVRLITSEIHSPPILSGSQGDAQMLSNGGEFVGWGARPYVSEFGPDGHVRFEVQLAAQSYRAFRFSWSGTPASQPSLAVRPAAGGALTAYASWNGATDVAAWALSVGQAANKLRRVAVTPSTGFETSIPLQTNSPWIAVTALDASGRTLASSPPVAR